MRALAIYTIIALGGFAVYSAYFAAVGDNAPFWIMIVVASLPVMAFALIYLIKKR